MSLETRIGRTPTGHRLRMGQKLTDKYVREAIHSGGKSADRYSDAAVSGFNLRITKSGHKSFAFRYEYQGRGRSISIGDYPVWSVSSAREQAAKYRRELDAGVDPREQMDADKRGSNLSQFWERYRTEALIRKADKTQKDETSLWERLILPRLGNKKLSHIERRDIEKMFMEVSTKTPTQANRMLSSIHYAFNKAVDWRDLNYNPASGIEKNSEHARDRYLSTAEMTVFLERLNARKDTATTLAIRFLLLTGARRGEVLKARWDQIDWEKLRWSKPPSNTKQRKRHVIPLSGPAFDILERAKKLSKSDFIFPAKNGTALYSLQKVVENVREEAGIDDFRLHDLRHCFASEIASEGIPIEFLSKLLGHGNITTTQRYAHFYDDPLRDAVERIGKRISNHGE